MRFKANQPLEPEHLAALMQRIPNWRCDAQTATISRRFKCASFDQNVYFINACFWVADTMDHHFELQAGYKDCTLCYRTHSTQAITLLDILCAMQIDTIFSQLHLEQSDP